MPVLFGTLEVAGKNAINFEFGISRKRRNFATLASVRVELPAVIAALHLFAVKPATGERHAAMRTSVTQGEYTAARIASDGQRNFEQHGFCELSATHPAAGQRAVPESEHHFSVRLRREEVAHGW